MNHGRPLTENEFLRRVRERLKGRILYAIDRDLTIREAKALCMENKFLIFELHRSNRLGVSIRTAEFCDSPDLEALIRSEAFPIPKYIEEKREAGKIVAFEQYPDLRGGWTWKEPNKPYNPGDSR